MGFLELKKKNKTYNPEFVKEILEAEQSMKKMNAE
jgi:hypothetical protein